MQVDRENIILADVIGRLEHLLARNQGLEEPADALEQAGALVSGIRPGIRQQHRRFKELRDHHLLEIAQQGVHGGSFDVGIQFPDFYLESLFLMQFLDELLDFLGIEDVIGL